MYPKFNRKSILKGKEPEYPIDFETYQRRVSYKWLTILLTILFIFFFIVLISV